MQDQPTEVIGDIDVDDAYDADDHKVIWDGIEALAAKYDDVLSAPHPTERLDAAKALVAEMDGA